MLLKLILVAACFGLVVCSKSHHVNRAKKILHKNHFAKLNAIPGPDHGFDEGSENKFDGKQGGCGVPKITPYVFLKIVGGIEALEHSWPWQVSIQDNYGGSFSYYCGGTIVAPNKILSAAHCFFDENHYRKPITNTYVVAGIHNIDESYGSNSQSRKVVKLIIHPSYNPASASSAYDIAVLYIQDPFVFGTNVSPACLPTSVVPAGTLCYTTGWGDTQGTGAEGVLNQVSVPVIDQTQCVSWLGSVIKSTMLCGGYSYGGKDSCQGDSGGPFVCKRNGVWNLDGIVSWGSGCAEPQKPGVYTRVFSYISWINAQMP